VRSKAQEIVLRVSPALKPKGRYHLGLALRRVDLGGPANLGKVHNQMVCDIE
jgi:hypothetical protein